MVDFAFIRDLLILNGLNASFSINLTLNDIFCADLGQKKKKKMKKQKGKWILLELIIFQN
jgi:hypothetical protein